MVYRIRRAESVVRLMSIFEFVLQILDEKLADMRSHVREEMKNSGTVKELLTGKQYRKAIFISVGPFPVCPVLALSYIPYWQSIKFIFSLKFQV